MGTQVCARDHNESNGSFTKTMSMRDRREYSVFFLMPTTDLIVGITPYSFVSHHLHQRYCENPVIRELTQNQMLIS